MLKDPQHVIHYNSFQVKGSYRRLFSKNADFELAKEMINENPDLGLVDRKRYEIGWAFMGYCILAILNI